MQDEPKRVANIINIILATHFLHAFYRTVNIAPRAVMHMHTLAKHNYTKEVLAII